MENVISGLLLVVDFVLHEMSEWMCDVNYKIKF